MSKKGTGGVKPAEKRGRETTKGGEVGTFKETSAVIIFCSRGKKKITFPARENYDAYEGKREKVPLAGAWAAREKILFLDPRKGAAERTTGGKKAP